MLLCCVSYCQCFLFQDFSQHPFTGLWLLCSGLRPLRIWRPGQLTLVLHNSYSNFVFIPFSFFFIPVWNSLVSVDATISHPPMYLFPRFWYGMSPSLETLGCAVRYPNTLSTPCWTSCGFTEHPYFKGWSLSYLSICLQDPEEDTVPGWGLTHAEQRESPWFLPAREQR